MICVKNGKNYFGITCIVPLCIVWIQSSPNMPSRQSHDRLSGVFYEISVK